MKLIKISLLLFLISQCEAKGQFKSLSGIRDTVNFSVVNHLQKAGFGKVTYYFDDLRKVEGRWELYPSLKISNNLIAVYVSTIPTRKVGYNFLLTFDPTTNTIIDTIGPFYDSSPSAIAVKLRNQRIVQLKVRLINPPELEEPKFTIIEYSRVRQILKQTKSYNKN
jgi:hypothetical protein